MIIHPSPDRPPGMAAMGTSFVGPSLGTSWMKGSAGINGERINGLSTTYLLMGDELG